MSKEVKKKISLSGVGLSKEDILKKFINKTASAEAVVHKNVEITPEPEKQEFFAEERQDNVPLSEQNFDVENFGSFQEKKIRNLKHKEKPQITIPQSLSLKPTPVISKKAKPETVKEKIHIFGTKTEDSAVKGIKISLEEDEDVQKEDHRDKSIIEKHLRHYKYLEFDNEKEIDSLRSGEMLRDILSKQRNIQDEEEIDIVSSFQNDERTRRKKKPSGFGGNKRKIAQVHSKQEREIEVPCLISATELANRLSLKIALIIEKARFIGEHIAEDDILDGDVAELIVEELGHKVVRVKEKTPEDILNRKALKTKMQTVPPVVTVMGHVDHGKTSLLDALRQTDVAMGEAGGITQAIGAYQVTMENGRKITFIDTPGHEAFTAMRSRGANATDIVILVVASDDSINTQTIEAIGHAKAAKCPIIVAVNKMDLPDANLQKVKEDLLSHDLVPEDFGGDISVMPVSALKKTGLKELEEQILLNADILELKANFDGHAGGVVLESRLDNKKGVVATVLIKHGVLKIGDVILAGTTFGRVRKMLDDKGNEMSEALPSMPVELYGFGEVPQAGERFFVMENEKSAREVISHRIERSLEEEGEARLNDDPFAALLKKEKKEINVIIRCDMQGSVDAIKYSLSKIQHEEIKLHIVQILVGNVTEADILLAKINHATIFAFNVNFGASEELLARKNAIAVREHTIIYKLIDEIKVLVSGALEPVVVETKVGMAVVRQVFDVSKAGKIAGLMVQDGAVKRNALAKVVRGGEIIAQGNIKTLKHFQEDVKSIQQGKECGMQMERFESFESGDIIEVYDVTYEQGKIS